MSAKPQPPLKNCPVCGIAMLASRSGDSLSHFDTFNCPSCRAIVSYVSRQSDPSGTLWVKKSAMCAIVHYDFNRMASVDQRQIGAR
jgi:hypothetical protein